jgi:peroxiredoxin
MTQATDRPLQPGDRAPDFVLPAVQSDRMLALAEYRGRSALLLALFRGLYCPFCRRAIAHLATTAGKLKPMGIETLAVIATELENARLYYRFRPIPLPLAVDPLLTTHRSYGLPRPELTAALMQQIESFRTDADGELAQPLPFQEAARAMDRLDRFERTPIDQRDQERQMPQLDGQFLIDRDGIIRWANIECAKEGVPAGLGKFPSYGELLTAAQIAAAI